MAPRFCCVGGRQVRGRQGQVSDGTQVLMRRGQAGEGQAGAGQR